MSIPVEYKMNHVALSVPPAQIQGSRRDELLTFFGEVLEPSEQLIFPGLVGVAVTDEDAGGRCDHEQFLSSV